MPSIQYQNLFKYPLLLDGLFLDFPTIITMLHFANFWTYFYRARAWYSWHDKCFHILQSINLDFKSGINFTLSPFPLTSSILDTRQRVFHEDLLSLASVWVHGWGHFSLALSLQVSFIHLKRSDRKNRGEIVPSYYFIFSL